MGVLSQRKHLVLGLLSRTCGTHCRDVTHGGQRGWKSRISYLKRASHLSRSYKNVCWLERSPLCFTLKQLRLGGFVNKTNLLQLLWVFSYWKDFKADDTVFRIMIPKAFYVHNDRKSSHYSFVQALIFLLQNDFLPH